MATEAPVRSGQATKAGVGFSENANSRDAGAEAGRAAFASAGLETCDLVLMFATSKHDPGALQDGVRSVVGHEAKLFGGSAVGIITGDQLGYEGFQVGVAAIALNGIDAEMFIERGLPDNEYGVGRALARQIRSRDYADPPNLLLIYDIVKKGMSEGGLSLNMATPLLAGMTEELEAWPPVAGGGLTGDMQWNPTFQWFDDRIEQHAAMALTLTGDVRMDTIVLHGCTPSSDYKTITKADGNVVLEFDGRPALEMIGEMLGPATDRSWEEYPLYITLGINHGEKFGEVRDDEYAVRLCMDIDKERGGLVMFGDDMQAGTEVQLMRRTLDLDYVERRATELLERVGERNPFLALYVDCAGRAGAYCGTEWEEAQGVQNVIGGRMPLLGWYVGCELAKAGPVMQTHNWTGVLSILSR